MTISPYTILFVSALTVVIAISVIVVLDVMKYRQDHPSINRRRDELERALTFDEITTDEYAEKQIALDDEASRARRRKT